MRLAITSKDKVSAPGLADPRSIAAQDALLLAIALRASRRRRIAKRAANIHCNGRGNRPRTCCSASLAFRVFSRAWRGWPRRRTNPSSSSGAARSRIWSLALRGGRSRQRRSWYARVIVFASSSTAPWWRHWWSSACAREHTQYVHRTPSRFRWEPGQVGSTNERRKQPHVETYVQYLGSDDAGVRPSRAIW